MALLLLLDSRARAGTGTDEWKEDEAALARDPEPSPTPAPPPAPPPRTAAEKLLAASLVFDFELRSGISWGSLSQFVPEYDEDVLFGVTGKDYALADLTLGSVELSLAVGTFLSRRWKIGYEAAGGVRAVFSSRDTLHVIGRLDGEGPSPPSREALRQTAGYLLPAGGYLAFYPAFSQSGGFSIGVHLGAGVFWGADYLGHGSFPATATMAADIGYETAWSDHLVWGVRARCGRTYFERNADATEKSSSLAVTDLSLALHLSAF